MPKLFVNQLTVIDCSILDTQRGLIGASWVVDVELHGELDEQSMVFDFAKVKKTIKRVIDQEVDHKLLVPGEYANIDIRSGSSINIHFRDERGEEIHHQSPASAICQIPAARVSRESVIGFLRTILLNALPANVSDLVIELHEEAAPGNYYSYSHGLKKHDGNCQRIAHGHRSQIQIWLDQERAEQLEQELATRWHDIYLGTREDITEQNNGFIRFSYTTDQGEFQLQLAEHRIHLMENDSTVECIAEHILELIQSETLVSISKAGRFADKLAVNVKVKAFEGIGKGAIAQNRITNI